MHSRSNQTGFSKPVFRKLFMTHLLSSGSADVRGEKVGHSAEEGHLRPHGAELQPGRPRLPGPGEPVW